MSELSKRSAKYFFIQGVKFSGSILLLQGILLLEWMLIGSGEGETMVDYVSSMVLILGGFFMVMMNLMFSMYGPNWYDSIALSMGARRKDVFWGEIIKQIAFILCSTIVFFVVVGFTKQEQFTRYIFMCAALSFMSGPIGLIIGHSVKKYGKAVMLVISVVLGVAGASAAVGNSLQYIYKAVGNLNLFVITILGILLFLCLELWVYKLNLKSMVK